MKAIVISHENGGSYVMDQKGCFRFVKRHVIMPVGTEIDLGARTARDCLIAGAVATCLLLTAVMAKAVKLPINELAVLIGKFKLG